MLSAGMFTALASAMMVRSRGLLSGSPPPALAATVSSLMMRVNTLPRLASAAPFLCLMVCHLEWPDIRKSPVKTRKGVPILLRPSRDDHPHVRARIPRPAAVIAEQRRDFEAGLLETPRHLRH